MRFGLLIFATNVVYAAMLVAVLVQVPVVRSPISHSGLRSNIERAATVDDLRPHARTAAEIIEASDRIEFWFYHQIIRLCVGGLAWAALNSVLLFFLCRSRGT